MNKYAILSTAHEDYNSIISEQETEFDSKEGASNYVPILNLVGTEALIKLYKSLPVSDCILSQGGDELPGTRTMTEWELPIS